MRKGKSSDERFNLSSSPVSEERVRRTGECDLAMWEAFFQGASQPIVILDRDHRVVAVNGAALKALEGRTEEEIPGSPCYKVFHGTDQPAQGCPAERLLLEGSTETVEMEMETLGGTYLVSCILLRDSSGKASRIIHMAVDITDRKRLEEERFELERRLFQTQKLKSLGVLAGGIAHDFNNLLMGIQGYTSLMLHDTQTPQPHQGKLVNIENLLRSGSDLTAQLLGFARGGKCEVKPLDLGMLIAKSADMFGRTKREVIIHTNLAKDLLPVDADQSQIEQVFLNLYFNAWQAMPGGGEIFIETRNVFLDESYTSQYSAEPGRYVKISVTDTGSGMDEETRKRIFEPFFTTKEMGRGSGLGLASAYGIIKNHRGIIEAASSGGHGSTFTIHLPASEKEPAREEKTLRVPRKGSETILLVDDQEMVVDAGREMLQALGYTVVAARNGQEALELYGCRKNAVALVLLDMIMPGMGGGETFDRLKEINPRIKVILSSGYSLDGQARQIMERGCSGFIQKPFDMDTLSKRIREVLEA
jgi:two-component system cell cycle sensor histidine kinase/response regulator CckA